MTCACFRVWRVLSLFVVLKMPKTEVLLGQRWAPASCKQIARKMRAKWPHLFIVALFVWMSAYWNERSVYCSKGSFRLSFVFSIPQVNESNLYHNPRRPINRIAGGTPKQCVAVHNYIYTLYKNSDPQMERVLRVRCHGGSKDSWVSIYIYII